MRVDTLSLRFLLSDRLIIIFHRWRHLRMKGPEADIPSNKEVILSFRPDKATTAFGWSLIITFYSSGSGPITKKVVQFVRIAWTRGDIAEPSKGGEVEESGRMVCRLNVTDVVII